jgi:glutamine amidotransferase
MKILIIDYGVGNHLSVANAFKFLGYNVSLSADKNDILKADVLILPGVGAFGEAMTNLMNLDLIDIIRGEVIGNNKPILGICLGMQILADYSEEGGHHPGLGLVPGSVLKIPAVPKHPVPHVGWNNVRVIKKDPVFSRVDDNANFYFDHSYQFVCDSEFVSASCEYGSEVTAAVQRGNIFGVQFHPEKSQNNGLKLFRGFVSHYEGQLS